LGRRVNEASVGVQVVDTAVIVDCYLIAAPETNLLELGFTVQATVAAAVREPAELPVRKVHVSKQDVEVGHG